MRLTRPGLGLMAATAATLAHGQLVRADTGGIGVGGPEVPVEGGLGSVLVVLIAVIAGAVVLAGLAALVRRLSPPVQRVVVAAGWLAAGSVVAGLAVVYGALSSWADAGWEIPVPFQVLAIVALFGGMGLAIRAVRGGDPPAT